ncbi:MAG: FtsX-like permease family protein [bacterium]|nr:FtsX-like permease family protein [bacterium]
MNKVSTNIKPPRIASWFLRRFLPEYDRQYLMGDFEETYIDIRSTKSSFRAWTWYWKQVFSSLPHFFRNNIDWRISMFRNYVKIAIRNIFKQKGYSFINITGLAFGMACSILIFLWVNDEINYDNFHDNGNDIYRILEDVYFTETNFRGYTAVPRRLAPALSEHYPEVIDFTRYLPGRNVVVSYENRMFNENYIANVDPSFLSIFSFDLISGEPETALSDPNSIVITKSTAERYFGGTDPVNKILRVDNKYDFRVTGVLEDTPSNSHLKFDILMPFVEDRWIGLPDGTPALTYSYVRLLPGTDFLEMDSKIRNFYSTIYSDDIRVDMFLQPLADIHLNSSQDNYGYLEGSGAIKYVYLFSIIAFFILAVACINFINLSTAKAATRAKEVGIRKVVGAHKRDVIRQFFSESIIMTAFSFTAAVGLVVLFLPFFNQLTEKELSVIILAGMDSILASVLLIFITGILAGSYPALFLSSFQPARVLKGLIFRKSRNNVSLRGSLVIFQFAVSIALILATFIISGQLDYIRNMELGFEKEHTLYVPLKESLQTNYESAKSELLQYPDITSVTVCSETPVNILRATDRFTWEGREITEQNANYSELVAHVFFVDYNSLETFGMQFIEGRNFQKEYSKDMEQGYIINETAAKAMGFNKASGKSLEMWGWEGEIVGVVEDFHFEPLRNEIKPLIIKMNPERLRYMFVTFTAGSGDISSVVSALEEKWNEFASDSPFEYNFLDDTFDSLYRNEQRLGTLFNYFTILAIFISCIGLFGLAAYMAEKRTKEIGVRKVLGAKMSGLVLLLTTDFIKWIITANIIAVPAAIYFMRNWLQNFAYRTEISWTIFLITTLIALAISLFSVFYQAVNAAYKNPVDSLRSE